MVGDQKQPYNVVPEKNIQTAFLTASTRLPNKGPLNDLENWPGP